jgi:hypothetical protein
MKNPLTRVLLLSAALIFLVRLSNCNVQLKQIPNLFSYNEEHQLTPYEFNTDEIFAEKFPHQIGDVTKYQYKLTFIPKNRTVLLKKNKENVDLTILQRTDQLTLIKKRQEVSLGMTGDITNDIDEDNIMEIVNEELSKEVPNPHFGRIRIHEYMEPQYSLDELVEATYNNHRVLAIMKDEYPDAFNFKFDSLDGALPDFDTVRKEYTQKIRKILEEDVKKVYEQVIESISSTLPEEVKTKFNTKVNIVSSTPKEYIIGAMSDSIDKTVKELKEDAYLALPVMDYYETEIKGALSQFDIEEVIQKKLMERKRNFMLDSAIEAVNMLDKKDDTIFIQSAKQLNHMYNRTHYLPNVMVKFIIEMIGDIIEKQIRENIKNKHENGPDGEEVSHHSNHVDDEHHSGESEHPSQNSEHPSQNSEHPSHVSENHDEHQSELHNSEKQDFASHKSSVSDETPDNVRSYADKAASWHPVDKLDINLYHIIDIIHKSVKDMIELYEKRFSMSFGPFTDAHLDTVKDYFVKKANFNNYILGFILGKNRNILEQFLLYYEKITSQRTFTYELYFTPLGADKIRNDNRGMWIDNDHFISKVPLMGETTKFNVENNFLNIFEMEKDEETPSQSEVSNETGKEIIPDMQSPRPEHQIDHDEDVAHKSQNNAIDKKSGQIDHPDIQDRSQGQLINDNHSDDRSDTKTKRINNSMWSGGNDTGGNLSKISRILVNV